MNQTLFGDDPACGIATEPNGDDFYTPQNILDWIGEIALDPCWSSASLVKANATIDLRRGEDGLLLPWKPKGNGVVFANVPFSNTAKWLAKAWREAQQLGRVVVVLCPAVPGDGPWHRLVWGRAFAVGFIAGRVDFVTPDGDMEQKGRGHALVVFGPMLACCDYLTEIRQRALGDPMAPVWVQEMYAPPVDDLPW